MVFSTRNRLSPSISACNIDMHHVVTAHETIDLNVFNLKFHSDNVEWDENKTNMLSDEILSCGCAQMCVRFMCDGVRAPGYVFG